MAGRCESKSAALLLLMGAAGLAPMAEAASFADRTALLVARDAWCADAAAAAATYGDIGTWDVSAVTDLSYVFCADSYYAPGGAGGDRGCNTACATFNSDISGWVTSKATTMEVRLHTRATSRSHARFASGSA